MPVSWRTCTIGGKRNLKTTAMKDTLCNIKWGSWPKILKRVWPSAFLNNILSTCRRWQPPGSRAIPWDCFALGFLPPQLYPSLVVERWGRGGRDLQRFPCASDLKVAVSVNYTSNGHGLLPAVWSSRRGGGIWAEYGPLPRHVALQNGVCSSVKTAQLKVSWEWHKIKAKGLSLSYHCCHVMEHLLTIVILHIIFKATRQD